MATALHAARWSEPVPGRPGAVRCVLCPRGCRLAEGQAGFCAVRRNEGGRLVLATWGRPTGFAVDPIEKKPLSHFHPGARVLSFGTAGCNLGCRFCQNWSISKAKLDLVASEAEWTPDRVVALARRAEAPGIAFTYNDPIIWAEYALDVAEAAHRAGLFTVFVTNGYVSPAARAELLPAMDAANVDLKAFTEGFYARQTLSHLAPVLDTLEWLARDGRTWVEVTNLLIPGLNDAPAETRDLARWLVEHMGPDVPLHLSAFHPAFQLTDRPRTPTATLVRAREVAMAAGLRYVYTGNVVDPAGQTTSCPGCGAAVIERDGYAVGAMRLAGGACAACGTAIAGRFEGRSPVRASRAT